MLTPEGLFFAPGVRFRDLDVNDREALANALASRAERWFFEPAESVASSAPFASGIVTVCFIDAAAEFAGMTMVDWLQSAVPDTLARDPRRNGKSIAVSFQEDVRNGLVHHARLSRGAEFSTELERPMLIIGNVLVVNPILLLAALRARWESFLEDVRSDPHVHEAAARQLVRVFSADFEADARWRGPA
jgi:hypothetical protein